MTTPDPLSDGWWIVSLWQHDGRPYSAMAKALGVAPGTLGRAAQRLGFRRAGHRQGPRFTSGPCIGCEVTYRRDQLDDGHLCPACGEWDEAPEVQPEPVVPTEAEAAALAKEELGEALTLREERAVHGFRMRKREAGQMRALPEDVRTVTKGGAPVGSYRGVRSA